MSNIQSRKYQITINNPDKHGFAREQILSTLAKFHLMYYCLADEIGNQGTYHVHIFMCSESPIRLTTVKSRFPTAHIEVAYGSCMENRNYILKEGKWAETEKSETIVAGTFYEKGELPSETSEKHPLMSRVLEEIKSGKSTTQIINEHPNLSFRGKDIDNLRQRFLYDYYSKNNRDVKVFYLYGKTGTGKTTSIYTEHSAEEICRITSYQNSKAIFDSYQAQRILVLEEFRSQIPIAELLSILDFWPLLLPARYYDRVACYEIVYLVSNIDLFSQYCDIQHAQPETWSALLRRIDTIRYFSAPNEYTDYPCEEGGFFPL